MTRIRIYDLDEPEFICPTESLIDGKTGRVLRHYYMGDDFYAPKDEFVQRKEDNGFTCCSR